MVLTDASSQHQWLSPSSSGGPNPHHISGCYPNLECHNKIAQRRPRITLHQQQYQIQNLHNGRTETCTSLSTATHQGSHSSLRRGATQSPRKRDAPALLTSTSAPLLKPPSSGLRTDPFSAYPIPVNKSVQTSIDYYLQVFGPTNSDSLTIPGHPVAAVSILFNFALQHPPLFDAVLSLTRSSMLLKEGNVFPTADKGVMIHRWRAFAGLRQKLTNPDEATDDATMFIVTHLASLELFEGNSDAALTHMKGINRIIQLRGGFTEEENNPRILYFKQTMEILTSVAQFLEGALPTYGARGSLSRSSSTSIDTQTSETSTSMAPLRYPSHPFNTDLCTILAQIPAGFSETIVAHPISIGMINLLADVAKLFKTMSYDFPDESSQASDIESFHAASHFVSNKLIKYQTENAVDEKETILTTSLITMLVYLRHATRPNEPIEHNTIDKEARDSNVAFWNHSPVDMIICDFSSTSPDSEHLDKNCLIWCSISCASLMLSEDPPLKLGDQIMAAVLDVFDTETKQWKKLEKILKAFFWNDWLLRSWKACWERCMEIKVLKQKGKQWLEERYSLPPRHWRYAAQVQDWTYPNFPGCDEGMEDMEYADAECDDDAQLGDM